MKISLFEKNIVSKSSKITPPPPQLSRLWHPPLAIEKAALLALGCGQYCKHETNMAGGLGCRGESYVTLPPQ